MSASSLFIVVTFYIIGEYTLQIAILDEK